MNDVTTPGMIDWYFYLLDTGTGIYQIFVLMLNILFSLLEVARAKLQRSQLSIDEASIARARIPGRGARVRRPGRHTRPLRSHSRSYVIAEQTACPIRQSILLSQSKGPPDALGEVNRLA